jgi:hypothetical protein
MSAKKVLRRVALAVGGGFLLVVIGVAFRLWDNGQVRVHSAEQAVEMAKAAAGPGVARLSVRVEAEQDFWTVRFGPDDKGQTHSYLVSIWDKQAGPLLEQGATEVAIKRPK